MALLYRYSLIKEEREIKKIGRKSWKLRDHLIMLYFWKILDMDNVAE